MLPAAPLARGNQSASAHLLTDLQHRSVLRICKKRFRSRPAHWRRQTRYVAAALRAEAWAGEPFVREGEDPADALAEGTARRRALDDALAEMDAGLGAPSSKWKVRYGLLLGLERVLAEPEPPHAPPAPRSAATRSTRSPGCSPS